MISRRAIGGKRRVKLPMLSRLSFSLLTIMQGRRNAKLLAEMSDQLKAEREVDSVKLGKAVFGMPCSLPAHNLPSLTSVESPEHGAWNKIPCTGLTELPNPVSREGRAGGGAIRLAVCHL